MVLHAGCLVCVSVDAHEYEVNVDETHDDVAAAAAAADDDDNDNEYFEDVSSSVPSLSELRQQIVAVIGESLFSRVYSVVQVTHLTCLVLLHGWFPW